MFAGKQYSVMNVVNTLRKYYQKLNVKSLKSKRRKIDRMSQVGSNKKIIKF